MIKAYYDDLNRIVLKGVQDRMIVKFLNACVELSGVISSKTVMHTQKLDVGKPHYVNVDGENIAVEMRGIVKTPWFKETYQSDEKLGSTVENGTTTFRLYAPTAHEVNLLLFDDVIAMTRNQSGIYEHQVNDNLHGKPYLYEVVRYGERFKITDPYAKASLPNRSGSVVVDFGFYKSDKPRFKASDNPIILELSVRDFSMDPEVPFVNRGKFLGLLESHGKYGMNHVLDLGVTHIQLMPVADFETVNELNPFERYNWGYDTMQSMSFEGSYSSNVLNPLQVIEDFRKVVDEYHAQNIGVNLDVVFNHVYDVKTHPLHISVPYYFFRYDENYELSNGSFCGNELASEMPMTRRYIVDSVVHFVENFDIDGIRFDLMGLSDIETMNRVSKSVRELKQCVMLYGEGWSMPTVLPEAEHSSMKNVRKMSGIGHFNDRFRNALIGEMDASRMGLDVNTASLADINEILNRSYELLEVPEQSINYAECHDNYTLADRLMKNGLDERYAFPMNALVILGRGIPFLQIGQSFFRNKQGHENTYNLSDDVNAIKWHYLDTYESLNTATKTWIKLRQAHPGWIFEIANNVMVDEKNQKLYISKNSLISGDFQN